MQFLQVLQYLQGSSLGQFFKQFLEPIKLNDVKVHLLYETIQS